MRYVETPKYQNRTTILAFPSLAYGRGSSELLTSQPRLKALLNLSQLRTHELIVHDEALLILLCSCLRRSTQQVELTSANGAVSAAINSASAAGSTARVVNRLKRILCECLFSVFSLTPTLLTAIADPLQRFTHLSHHLCPHAIVLLSHFIMTTCGSGICAWLTD